MSQITGASMLSPFSNQATNNPSPVGQNSPAQYTAPSNLLSSDATINGQYLVDYTTFEYPYVSGQIALPNTGEPGITVVTLHQPMGLKIVRFEKVRLETPPDYPQADNGDANAVLLWKNLQVFTPGVMTDMQSRIFAVRGIYVYALKTPVQD